VTWPVSMEDEHARLAVRRLAGDGGETLEGVVEDGLALGGGKDARAEADEAARGISNSRWVWASPRGSMDLNLALGARRQAP